MTEKLRVLTLSDHPLIPSGVGLQTRYVIEGLLATGRYKFHSAGGAIQHNDYRLQNVFPEKYHGDWIVEPTNGYGDRERMRKWLDTYKPDVLFIVTDPRFYIWLFEMEDEINMQCPIVYWHVWDNDPAPQFNDAYYDCITHIAPLSLKTHGLLQDLKKTGHLRTPFTYIPHAIPQDTFKPIPEEEVFKFRRDKLGPHADSKFIVFFNSRNARRKMTGDVIGSFAQFANKVGRQNVTLFMQTQPKDQEGQDLQAVAERFKIDDRMIISADRVEPEILNMFYNSADVTVNLSNNEGFGLSPLESLMCGTPILVHMTGGLQFQVGDWWKDRTDFSDQDEMTADQKKKWKNKEGNWWGVPVFPTSRSCTGSQPIPYIYDDRFAYEDVSDGLVQLYNMSRAERKALGLKAREWAIQNFNMQNMIQSFDDLFKKSLVDHKKPYAKLVTL
jgi:glycosyltransferase involved in cell wall biosynthesis